MNLKRPARAIARLLHFVLFELRYRLPRQLCNSFSLSTTPVKSGIDHIYVINLDRQPERWHDMKRVLSRVVDSTRTPLFNRTLRVSAHDSRVSCPNEAQAEVDPIYTLADQLFVEPQPSAMPERLDLDCPIRMTGPEVAIARSHIGTWRLLTQSEHNFALILEDDTVFDRNFSRDLDRAWNEMTREDGGEPRFDLLYLSYEEVRHGAPKRSVANHYFCPVRGLWFLSGYVLSRNGARLLLSLLPCRGPVDLWINHVFRALEVRALSRPVVHQRGDLKSTNSYSILPMLNRIGVLDAQDASIFHTQLPHTPVFAFGGVGGLSSLAMALSMLGYRCCSDLETLPAAELDRVLKKRPTRVFDAYVNIGELSSIAIDIARLYPDAKYVLLVGDGEQPSNGLLSSLADNDVLVVRTKDLSNWTMLCEHLRVAPPDAPYPVIQDIGQRRLQADERSTLMPSQRLCRHDPSPWIVPSQECWQGIAVESSAASSAFPTALRFEDNLEPLDFNRWALRTDTFPDNLALFRPSNVTNAPGGGLALLVKSEPLGVRAYSAAALSSRSMFLFGRFEATFRAVGVPGVVTGFFLHRNSPRQEIDVEIPGDRPDCMLVNVFFNPGTEGAKFDYGYRGTPVIVKLGFDASRDLHTFAIEWDPASIRWFVDGKLVHSRSLWQPTPIPHLPMTLHVNVWPTRSTELAGRIKASSIPAFVLLRRVLVDSGDTTPSDK